MRLLIPLEKNARQNLVSSAWLVNSKNLWACVSVKLNDFAQLEFKTKIKAIMEKQEEKILNYATNSYISAPPDKTDGEMEDEYPKVAKHKEIIEYIYILGEEEKLLGIINLRGLLQSRSEDLLRDIMTENVVSLNPKSTLKEALTMFSRYEFRALPITDRNDKLLGVITYRDIKNLKHRFLE